MPFIEIKSVYTQSAEKINILIVLFSQSTSLNKIEELITLNLETKHEKEMKKDCRKHQQVNKQESINEENKTSSK